MNTQPTTSAHRPKRRYVLVGIVAAFSLGAAACGSDDNTSTPDTAAVATDAPAEEQPEPVATDPVPTEPATTDPTVEEPAAEEVDPGLSIIWDELVAAGLTSDQATCVVETASDEWGIDALVGEGNINDDQLLRLGEITFGCS